MSVEILSAAGHYLVSSGFGPAECELAVAHFAEYAKRALHCWTTDRIAGSRPGTFRSVVLAAPPKKDNAVQSVLDDFIGSVMWTCRSPFRPTHKRKNWFIRVTPYDPSELTGGPYLWREDFIRFETFRSNGHGGQNVNKVETGVRATYSAPFVAYSEPLTVVCTRERSQLANRREAVRLLHELVQGKIRARNARCENDRWREHTRLERGHPVAVFEGTSFVRVK